MAVSKTHGLNLSLSTDFSEDTSHGDSLKSYIPGLQDFKLTINAWYDTAYAVLESMSKNKTSEYFQLYPDFADTLNYYRGQCYVGLDGLPLDIGNTADLTFTSTIANADIAIIRGGVAL